MSKLTRRRDHNARQESRRIYYGDIRVGAVGKLAGVPPEVNQWAWSCGFYPGLEMLARRCDRSRHIHIAYLHRAHDAGLILSEPSSGSIVRLS
jgi:hypothetical protein